MSNAVLELARIAIAVATESYMSTLLPEVTWALTNELPMGDTGLFVTLYDDHADVALFVALVRTYERQAELYGLADLQRQGLALARRAYGLEP